MRFRALHPLPAACLVLTLACARETTEPDYLPPPGPELRAWSDPATWPGRRVPGAGAEVVIPAGIRVVLDVSPPPLRSLLVEGELHAGDQDVELSAGWIMVHGLFQAGSEAAPHPRRLAITLTGPTNDNVMGMGARVLGVMSGGRLELHGEPRTGWTRLAGTVAPGASQLLLAGDVAWRTGDRIVVASSDFDPLKVDEAVIAGVQGRTLTLAAPLAYAHYGQLQTYGARTVDERAEVGLLSRNIRIQGDASTTATGQGGHLMVVQGGTARVEGVELFLMGQRSQLARYPMHWHVMGEAPGQYFRNSAVWKSQNRCVTIHGTDQVEVAGNVCYDHLGHGYFLEDGAESGNRLEGNLGLVGRAPPEGQMLLASDATPATFWITHPDNVVRGNHAAGSAGFGFWYAMPERPTGLSAGQPDYPRTTPLGEFSDNVAHSNKRNGLHVDNGARPDGTTETFSYRPRQNPAAASPAVTAVFRNFTAYKHTQRGVWLRGTEQRLVGAVLADNAIGATFAANEVYVEDALFVAQTANQGTPFPAGFPVRGYEFYDGKVGARRVTFVNYMPGAGRQMSALGFNRSNAFALNPGNYASELTFVSSNRVYIENPGPDRDGDKSAVFLDADGSVTGTAGRFVAANNPLLVTPACTLRPEWNAYDCGNRFVRLQVRGINGETVAPVTVMRDDAAAMRYVGTGGDPDDVSAALPVGRRYTLSPETAVARSPRFFLTGLQAGEWVRLSLPYPGPTVRAYRDYNTTVQMPAAASLAELDGSSGDRFYFDAGAQMLHLKLMPQAGRDYAVVFVTP